MLHCRRENDDTRDVNYNLCCLLKHPGEHLIYGWASDKETAEDWQQKEYNTFRFPLVDHFSIPLMSESCGQATFDDVDWEAALEARDPMENDNFWPSYNATAYGNSSDGWMPSARTGEASSAPAAQLTQSSMGLW